MMSIFNKNNSAQQTIITLDGDFYTIVFDNLQKSLSQSEILSNILLYEGVEDNIKQNVITIFSDAIFDIESEILEELNIYQYTGLIKILKDGIFQIGDVKYYSQFYNNPTHRIDYKKIGNLLFNNGKYFLLSNTDSKLLNEIENYNTDKSQYSKTEEQFRISSKIKKTPSKTLLKNEDLENYNEVFLDEIGVEFNPVSPDKTIIKPKLLGSSNSYNTEFNEIFQNSNDISPLYSLGENTFLILDEEKQEGLKTLKKNSVIEGKENIKEFINRIEEKLPGFTISSRVVGWGEYNLPGLSRDSNNLVWIREIDEAGKEIKKIRFYTKSNEVVEIPEEYSLENLYTKISEATINQESHIDLEIENTPSILVEDAKILSQILSSIFESKLESNQNKTSPTKNEFVIIKTGFEELEYVEDTTLSRITNYEAPNIISTFRWNLYPYQKEGIQWLQSLSNSILGSSTNQQIGGLLADDMGLGKTLQILTYLAWLKEKNQLKKALIILPMTLISNWSSHNSVSDQPSGEIEQFFPNLFHPIPIRSNGDLSLIKDPKYDLVLASYDTVMMQSKTETKFINSFGSINWDVIICDEAQKIKNPATKRTIAVKALNGKVKIACTATPIENRMEELWSISDWIVPGKLGTLSEFRKHFITQINNSSDNVHNELTERLKGFYIRRTKEQVLSDSLPGKNIIVTILPATEAQRNANRELQNSDIQDILPLIGKLIGIMSHPGFLNKSIVNINSFSLEAESNKFRWLKTVLKEIESRNEKVLIFTPSKWIQTAIRKYIKEIFKYDPIIVNGDVKGNLRLSEIQKVTNSNGFGVLILSPEVAGFGITITEANNIIHFSRGWNPAKENQATDRAYRIGQKNDVKVYIPIVSWTQTETITKVFRSNDEYYDWNIVPNNSSPEENLDQIMRRKGKLLKNFFSVAANISADELFRTFIPTESDTINTPVSDLINMVTPIEFEALCALVFEANGYKTILTPTSGDLGVDVVVENYNNNLPLLLQVNKSQYQLKNSKVQEVIAAKASYSKALGSTCLIGVFSNASIASKTSKKLIRENDIYIFDFDEIVKLSMDKIISYKDVLVREKHREQLIVNL